MSADLREWAKRVHQLAVDKGWYDQPQTEDAFLERACNNLHDEVSELHEAWRNGKLRHSCNKGAACPLTNLEEELADIIIRTMDDAERLGVNIQLAVEVKHAFNATRPQRHGGKLS